MEEINLNTKERLRQYVHDHLICNTIGELKSDSIYLLNDLFCFGGEENEKSPILMRLSCQTMQ
jgi:hypothetical protein